MREMQIDIKPFNKDYYLIRANDFETVREYMLIIEKNYSHTKKPVLLNLQNTSDCVLETINKYPLIFFKCSPKRLLLVKWIIDEIDTYFYKNSVQSIKMITLYNLLRDSFKAYSFNLSNLKTLFRSDVVLNYNNYALIRNHVMRLYKTCIDEQSSEILKLIRWPSEIKTLKPIVSEFIKQDGEVNKGWPFIVAFTNFSSQEIRIATSLQNAIDDLGKEICLELLKCTNKTLYLSAILQSWNNSFEKDERLRQIESALNCISQNNMDAKIKPYLLACDMRQEARSKIIKVLDEFGASQIKDLNNVSSNFTDQALFEDYLYFIRWLSLDRVSLLKTEFIKTFKSKRDNDILEMRAKGLTLAEAGEDYNITRERVRQIENKLFRKFLWYISKFKPHHILHAYSVDEVLLSIDIIKDFLDDLANIFIYCFKKSNSKSINWCDKLGSFIIGDITWHDQLTKYTNSMPEKFDASDLDGYILEAKSLIEVEVKYEFIKNFILSVYKVTGNLISKKEVRKSDIYSAVLEKHYPSGIKLFNDLEMLRFRNYVRDLFGDVKLPDNDRAICARIADITILCGRGKYLLPLKAHYDANTIKKIYDYIINNDRNTITFSELFEIFKDDLLSMSNINNKYFLQGLLKLLYASDFIFTKDALIKDGKTKDNISISIIKLIKDKKRIVNRYEIQKEFKGVSEVVISATVSNSEEIILWSFNKYLHVDKLIIDQKSIISLKRLLDNYITKGPTSISIVYNDLFAQENEFLKMNNIDGHYPLFSILVHLFGDKYTFRRPYIALKEAECASFTEMVRDYLSNFSEISITELKDYVESIRPGNYSFSSIIDSISDEFFRSDCELLIRKERLVLNNSTIEHIEDSTLALMEKKGYIAIKMVNDYNLYPPIGIKWTGYLLNSIIKNCSHKLAIISVSEDYRYINQIVVDKDLLINNYDELLMFALRQEAKCDPFKKNTEVEEFLREQSLINKNIPRSLYKKGLIVKSEAGKIIIR